MREALGYRSETTSQADGKMALVFSHKIVREDGFVVHWCRGEQEARLELERLKAQADENEKGP